MDWRLLLLLWQVLFLVGVGQKAAAAKVPVGCTDAPSGRSQRGAKAGPSAAASEHDEVASSSLKDYWFKTGVEDAERGFMQGRAETKRGDQVVGSYQYSDGNVKVKVVYAADDDGYRVLKEERVTLKPFTDSETPNQKPEPPHQKPDVAYRKPHVTHKNPKGKPRRPGSKPRPKPSVYKHPQTKPSFTRYTDPFPGHGPNAFSETSSSSFSGRNVFSESSSGTFSGDTDLFSGNAPNGVSGNSPDIFSSNAPDIFSSNNPFEGNGSKDFPGNKPDAFLGTKQDLFSGSKPGFFPGNKPKPVKTPEPSSTKKPETKAQPAAPSSEGSQGLQLPSLEGLDGYSVKLRTNHGSGYSVQGFHSSPGTPQVVKYGKNGQPPGDGDSGGLNRNPFTEDDQFNHSLESRDEFRPRPAIPMRDFRLKVRKVRKRRPKTRTDNLAFFVKEPPIDPKVVLFKPHPRSNTKNAKRSPQFRPAEGLRL